jgi:hypothetical protein
MAHYAAVSSWWCWGMGLAQTRFFFRRHAGEGRPPCRVDEGRRGWRVGMGPSLRWGDVSARREGWSSGELQCHAPPGSKYHLEPKPLWGPVLPPAPIVPAPWPACRRGVPLGGWFARLPKPARSPWSGPDGAEAAVRSLWPVSGRSRRGSAVVAGRPKPPPFPARSVRGPRPRRFPDPSGEAAEAAAPSGFFRLPLYGQSHRAASGTLKPRPKPAHQGFSLHRMPGKPRDAPSGTRNFGRSRFRGFPRFRGQPLSLGIRPSSGEPDFRTGATRV